MARTKAGAGKISRTEAALANLAGMVRLIAGRLGDHVAIDEP